MFCKFLVLILALLLVDVTGQAYEDKRCKCICPSLAAVLNSSLSKERRLFIANVPPNQCNCDGVILPQVGDEIKSREQEYCPRCDCKYEIRNTTVIKVVVVMVVWVLTLLMVYMVFLKCLGPFVHKRRPKMYRDLGNGEDSSHLLQDDEY